MPYILRRHFAYFAFASISLTLSVGATLAVFTVVNALWLRPMPFHDVDRLVFIVGDAKSGSADTTFFDSVETSTAWTAFESVAGQVVTTGYLGPLNPRVEFENARGEVETLGVTSRYFSVLGISIRGRDFTREDNRYGAEPVAIISDRLWDRAFGRRTDVIGAVAAANPLSLRIIGVAPAGMYGARHGEQIDVWIPSNLVPRVAAVGDVDEDRIPTLMLARLHGGQTIADAKRRLVADATTVWDREAKERAQIVALKAVFGTPTARTVVISGGRARGVVAGLAGLVLLAGCTTLMALALVHFEQRRRELSVRLALGAARWRLIADLLRQLSLPAIAGTVGAILIAFWGLRVVPSLSLPGGVNLSRLDLSIDWRVLGFALVGTLLSLGIATFIPIRRFTNERLVGDLVGSTATPSASSHRFRQLLVGVHVSATIVVLVSAGLFVRAVLYGFTLGAGFDVDHSIFVQAQLGPPYGTVSKALTASVNSRTQRLEEGLRRLSGVQMVAKGRSPIGGDSTSLLLTRTIQTSEGFRDFRLGVMAEAPELLRALGVPILRGRELTAADARVRPVPVIVTASLARTLWPGKDPVGQSLVQLVNGRLGTSQVVGVAADFAYASLGEAPAGVLVGVSSFPGGPSYVVRTVPEADILMGSIRRLLHDLLPDAPRIVVTTGRQVVTDDLASQRLGAWFFSGFGLVALILGLGGIFGLVAHLAQSRRREFGVRLALGATPVDLLKSGTAAGLVPVLGGAGVGILAAAITSHAFIAFLPGLTTLDPVTYFSVAGMMVISAGLASLAAAWPLLHVRPSEVLRAE